jgi:hypothetical protein
MSGPSALPPAIVVKPRLLDGLGGALPGALALTLHRR